MAYEVHISRFDGPLDLLLHLIEKAEVDIREVFISDITSQYLEYMQMADELDMDTASEFLAMAATLLFIKSRSLLPVQKKEQLDGEDPEEVLIRQLREYKEFKEAGRLFSLMQEAAHGVFTKLPEEYPLPPPNVELTGATLDDLFSALTLVLAKERAPITNLAREVRMDAFSVTERKEYILRRLERGSMTFDELFERSASRAEIVTTFMALLELVTLLQVSAVQHEAFSLIRIKLRKPGVKAGAS